MVYSSPFSRRFVPEPQGIPGTRRDHQDGALAREACHAVGLPYGIDLASGRTGDIHHLLGTMSVSASHGAAEAVIASYRKRLPDAPSIHAFMREYPLLAKELSQSELHAAYIAHLQQLSGDTASDPLKALNVELPVHLPEKERWRHTYMVGATGYGKSELLKALVYSYVAQPNSAAVVVIDPAGEFVEQIAHWPEFVGNDRLIYVNPTLTHGLSPRINPFEISGVSPLDTSDAAIGIKQVIAQQLVAAFQEVIAGGMGSAVSLLMRALLMPCILTLLDRPGSTFLDLQRFMQDRENGDLVAFGTTRTHYRAIASFFQSDFGDRRFVTTKGSIATKLQDLFSTGFFVDLTCGESTIDLRRAIEARKIILFNLSKGRIGDAESQAFGRLIVAMLQGIAKRRVDLPEERRVPTHLVIDECHNFITESVREILLEARKYRLFLTLAQQIVGEGMSLGMRDVITGSANIQMSGYAQPLHQADAARLVSLPPEAIARLDKGEFFVRLSRHPAFKLRARSDLVGFKHRMTAPSWNRLLARQLRAYYRPKVPETITTQSDPHQPPKSRPFEPDFV